MEDFIIREIDRLGEMLALIAKKLGLMDSAPTCYSMDDIAKEFRQSDMPIVLSAVLEQDNPVMYLVETCKISDRGLETFIEIIFHSDMDASVKSALLEEALAYLDNKGYYSFSLHSLS